MMKSPPQKIIYDNQIELRLMSPKDGRSIYQGVLESLPELKRFMSWAHGESDFDQSCAIYAEFEAKSLRGEELNFAGFDVKSGDFLFCCSLLPGSRLNPLAFEMGFWVCSAKAGKGLGTVIAKILTVLAFCEYQADRVSVVCNRENTRSQRVIEKTEFRTEGYLRNYLLQPTPEMLAGGYSPVRDVQAFSLIFEDIPSLLWFPEVHRNLSITWK